MTKTGRGRMYEIKPLVGFTNREIGIKAAWLDEYRERVYDQIEDLPEEALNYEIGQTRISIGRLVLHMAWAEALFVSRMTGAVTPPDIEKSIHTGALADFDEAPAPSPPAAELIRICRRVRDEITVPEMQPVPEADTPCLDDGSTVRGILGQLEWHWIYHSGQIGLLRFDWGSDYVWTKGSPMAPQG